MQARTLFITLLTTAVFALCVDADNSPPGLQVKTDSGVLTGHIELSSPHVRQFLGIPYALPPMGARRWLPPKKNYSPHPFAATSIGPACPQQLVRDASVYSVNGGNLTEVFPLEVFSEDCLTLNVWTPTNPPQSGLPVIVWFFGGRFIQGGTNSRFFDPQSWVERTQEHIVVAVNFRSNIFGFPNAAGLEEQNLGLLDQRLALEWVRDNIAGFGGDANKMVLWGESAGAIASDFLNFAYPSDPIVTGLILASATALFPTAASVSFDTAHTNFSFVVEAVGCGMAESQLDCARNVSWQTIEGVISTDTSLLFQPTIDDRIVFANYTLRYANGAMSSIPAIIGTNEFELNALKPQLPGVPFAEHALVAVANATFLSGAAHASAFRDKRSLTTYRYRYDGDFANISPPEYPGAFHTAELPLIFGTAGKYHGASTEYEDEVSRKLQDFWLEFAKDPKDGLGRVGWGNYADGKAVIIGGKQVAVEEIDIAQLDGMFGLLP